MKTGLIPRLFFLKTILCLQLLCAQNPGAIQMEDTYPWCIVAYDSLNRGPEERIALLKELGFTKYAYDWREKHLVDTRAELVLAQENNIQVISVWLWLNAKRDSIDQLSAANNKLFDIVENLNLRTTFWLGLSPNYFEDLTSDESLKLAIQIVDKIATKAQKINCSLALYNHSGWFADPYNEMKIIEALPEHNLSMIYNFHHAHNSIDRFQELAKAIAPYLSAVNLNGMRKDGSKILEIGEGDHEKEMIKILIDSGFKGPWGILGHTENEDVREVLERNLAGLKTLH
jgi:hypothetical protein